MSRTCFAHAAGLLLFLATPVAQQPCPGDTINALSRTHHIWGEIVEQSYDMTAGYPIEHEISEYVPGGPFPGTVTLGSSTFGSTDAALKVHAYCDSGGDFMYAEQANAEVSYDFRPATSATTIQFIDAFASFWYFESWLYYRLENLDSGSLVESREWACDWDEWTELGEYDGAPPESLTYSLDKNSNYRITAGAHAELSDHRTGSAGLTVVIPEPTSALMLMIAAFAGRRTWRR